jgi:hypothetical protein
MLKMLSYISVEMSSQDKHTTVTEETPLTDAEVKYKGIQVIQGI